MNKEQYKINEKVKKLNKTITIPEDFKITTVSDPEKGKILKTTLTKRNRVYKKRKIKWN